MSVPDPKAQLHRYLRLGREAILWKLDGLSEYDARRPLTPTGTNLLGLVRHLASVELGYFGAPFGRPSDEPLPWYAEDADPNDDMWVTAAETRADVIGLYHRAWAHADATIEALPLDAVGLVPHWPADRAEVSLHQVLVHVATETHRHAGHADILRELIDGAAGLRPGHDNLAYTDPDRWRAHREQVERAAREAEGPAGARESSGAII